MGGGGGGKSGLPKIEGGQQHAAISLCLGFLLVRGDSMSVLLKTKAA